MPFRRVRPGYLVGLEYTIVMMTCIFSNGMGYQAVIWYSCVSPPRTCFLWIRVLGEVHLRGWGVGLSGCELAKSTVRSRGVVVRQVLSQHLAQVVMLAASMAAWLHQLTAATRGQTILAGHGVRGGKAMIETLRRRLISVPGRLVRRAGQLTLRLPPGHGLLAEVLARLRALPALP